MTHSHARALVLDTLTGAFGRHAFAARLESMLAHAQDAGQSLALLLIDLDYFKSINDGFGHQRGDEVLAEVGRRLRASLRDVDQLFRYGGDEFVLLLPGVDRQQAAAVAERLLDGVRDEPFGDAPPLSLSLSVGLALFPGEAADAQSLFDCADRRAYHAKRSGRSQVVADDATAVAAPHVAGRLIERDGALATARSLLDLHQRGVRGQLCVSGPGGVGRSTMLAEVERLATARGVAVFHVRGRPGSRARVLGALAEALRDWPELSVQMPAPAAAVALAEACRGRGASLLLTIDNAADLDGATQTFLRALLTHPELPHTSLAYVENPDVSRWSLAGSTAQLYLALQPLSAEGIRVWLRYVLGWEAPDEFIAQMLRRTGGLPADLHSEVSALVACGALRAAGGGWVWNPTIQQAEPEKAARESDIAALLAAQPALVGRAEEIEAVRRGLSDRRLVTLVGPSGIGKSRTALQAAAECQGAYRDGAHVVTLGALTSDDLVPGAIASALRIEPGRNPDPRARVLRYLRGRELLLVLDNAEHLPGLASFIAELLDAAPRVAVLATSQTPLGLPSEQLVPLAGLAVGADAASGLSDAVEMFLRVVRGHHPEYAPTDEELGAVAAVCHLVGGVPLGVELTAAWAGSVPCGQIAAALAASRAAREAKLDTQDLAQLAAIEYSWSMLAAPERRVLRALAVFHGGFTREAARRVAGASPFFIDALAAKNLLRPMLRGRFQMHGLLHTYAAAQLRTRPSEQRAARARHRAYYLALLRACMHPARDPSSAATELHPELANIRAAWDQALTDERVEPMALRAGAYRTINAALRPLGRLYILAARFDEGLAAFDRAIAWLEPRAGPGAPPVARRVLAHAVQQRANLLFYVGAPDAKLAAIQRVLSLLAGDSQPRLEADAFLMWGIMLLVLSQLEAAREKLERAYALAAAVRDWEVLISALQHLCHVASLQGQGERGSAYALEAIRVAEREGYGQHARQTLFFLGFSRFAAERHAEARACFEQNVAHLHEDFSIGVLALVNLSATLLEQREYRQALAYADRAIRLTREAGMAYYEALALRVRGLVALANGRYDEAEHDLEAALVALEGAGAARDAARARADVALLAHLRGRHDVARAHAQHALDASREIGSTLAEAVALAPLGHAALALRELDAAADAYDRAQELFDAIGRRNRAAEVRVWLAQARWAQGRGEEARALALGFATHTGEGRARQAFDGMVSPASALAQCATLLEELGDARARACHAAAHELGAEIAAQLGDEPERHDVLEVAWRVA